MVEKLNESYGRALRDETQLVGQGEFKLSHYPKVQCDNLVPCISRRESLFRQARHVGGRRYFRES